MTNELQTQTPAELAVVETSLDSFTINRTGKGAKAATKTRTMLGVVNSGNAEEKALLGGFILMDLWKRHRYPQIKIELDRVFPKWVKDLKARNDNVLTVLAENPECGLAVVDPQEVGANKRATFAVMAVCKASGDGAKGEPGKVAAQIKEVLAYEYALQKELKAKAEAGKAPANT